MYTIYIKDIKWLTMSSVFANVLILDENPTLIIILKIKNRSL